MPACTTPRPRRSTTIGLSRRSPRNAHACEGLGRRRALARDRRGAARSRAGAQRRGRDRADARPFPDLSPARAAVARAALHDRARARQTGASTASSRILGPPLRHRPTRASCSTASASCSDNSFRPDTQMHFVNHHEAHALAALFFTDLDDALVYTSDGIGDNVSYSMRSLQDGKLDCLLRRRPLMLTRTVPEAGLASAYGYATVACRLQDAAPRGQADRACGLRRA